MTGDDLEMSVENVDCLKMRRETKADTHNHSNIHSGGSKIS